jgi:integrase
MISSHPKTATYPVFNKVGQNLYRLTTSGKYYALIKRGGKQIRRSLKTNDATLAKRRLAEFCGKVSRLKTTKDARLLSFMELANRWLEIQKVTLKASSALRISLCIKGLAPFFKDRSVRNISTDDCHSWHIRRGKTISAQSYKHERRVLIAILDYAVRNGFIMDNPARQDKLLPPRKIPKAKIVIPSREQFCILVKTIRAADIRAQHAGNLVELLAYSGMRLGEAINLLWGDVDFEKGHFAVTGGERGTKNLEARVLPLFPALRELLARIKGDRQTSANERVVPINCAQTAIINACKKAGLPHFLHHSLRHYFCSNAIEAGIDFKVIASWLGHKDGGFLVAKTYGHLRDTHSTEMAKRMTFSAVEVLT